MMHKHQTPPCVTVVRVINFCIIIIIVKNYQINLSERIFNKTLGSLKPKKAWHSPTISMFPY